MGSCIYLIFEQRSMQKMGYESFWPLNECKLLLVAKAELVKHDWRAPAEAVLAAPPNTALLFSADLQVQLQHLLCDRSPRKILSRRLCSVCTTLEAKSIVL